MRRNRALDRDGTAAAADGWRELPEEVSHALCLNPAYAHLRGGARTNARFIRVDRKAKAAEAASEAAIHVQKPEMQTSRCPDSDAFDHRAWRERTRALLRKARPLHCAKIVGLQHLK